MARRRIIVGLGEALLAEFPDREEPGGLALLVAVHAVRLGHTGIAISRLSQDDTAAVLLARLREAGVDVSHLQSDPDLATGRLVVRTIGGVSRLDAHAAWDNLQWDFDLTDVAQQADAVVFGAVIRRSGQSRSAADRFLAECKQALRVFDLTRRPESGLSHDALTTGLKHAECAVIDDEALHLLLPGAAGSSPRDMVVGLLRQWKVDAALVAQEGTPLIAHTIESSCAGAAAHRPETHEVGVVGFVHGLLSGRTLEESVSLAERLSRHALEHPGDPPPPELLEVPRN